MELSDIRDMLRECENSIIFAILERSRWKRNPSSYHKLSHGDSLFSSMLKGTEDLHQRLGRYHCPEESPFTKLESKVKKDIFPKKKYQINTYLHPNHLVINDNKIILDNYFKFLLPLITRDGEDENQGSAVTADINLLQALSRRIHLGKLVAEIKYRENPSAFMDKNRDTIYQNLTNDEVENVILERLNKKILHLVDDNNELFSIPNSNLVKNNIISIYQDYIIPLTKEVEIKYFKLYSN